MADISQVAQAPVVRMNADYNPRIVSFRGTTNVSGDITLDLGNDREGAFVAPSRATNTYTFQVGPFQRCSQFTVQTGLADATARVTSKSYTASTGAMVFTANTTLASTYIDVFVMLDRVADG